MSNETLPRPSEKEEKLGKKLKENLPELEQEYVMDTKTGIMMSKKEAEEERKRRLEGYSNN